MVVRIALIMRKKHRLIDSIKFMLSYRIDGEKREVNMDRLTKNNRDDNKGDYYYPECFERCDGLGTSEKCNECDFCYAVCEKLGKYEDLEEQVVERLKEASYERFGNDGMGGELVINLDDAIEIIKGGCKE